jgi:hypothetical protein
MVFAIIFNPALEAPLSYHWGNDVYEACADCLRTHELRTCDGETKFSYQICAKHTEV